MKKILSLIVLLSAMSVMAIDIEPVAKKCAACHGQKGERKALNASKIIKDMSKADFVASLHGYKDGSYGGAKKNLMKPQVIKLSDEQIEALAAKYTAK